MSQGYFDRSPLSLKTSPAVASIRHEASPPISARSRQPSSLASAEVDRSRPPVRSLQSTQDILQHKHTIERIANAFAA